MSARRFFYVSLGILALAIAYHLGASRVTAQGELARDRASASALSSSQGRYVFGEVSEREYMLDTQAGKLWELHELSEASATSASDDSVVFIPGSVLDPVPYEHNVFWEKQKKIRHANFVPD